VGVAGHGRALTAAARLHGGPGRLRRACGDSGGSGPTTISHTYLTHTLPDDDDDVPLYGQQADPTPVRVEAAYGRSRPTRVSSGVCFVLVDVVRSAVEARDLVPDDIQSMPSKPGNLFQTT